MQRRKKWNINQWIKYLTGRYGNPQHGRC